MPSPFFSLFGNRQRAAPRRAVEPIVPQRTFADVVLPPATRAQLDHALAQVRNHALIFGRWGLGERHATGLGLAFNFAGPPGTGKTICAEAIAHALGMRLLVVDYAEIESMWAGETPKNVSAVFRAAAEEDAVLFFDEADAIAARRSTSLGGGNGAYQRESNIAVNVLLRELEGFNGVVIFATNLAANFDPAFERRIRTHVLFEMPGPEERSRIWAVQVHPTRTPLADDVSFAALAERHAVAGGDIKNAVLKAAAAAAAEPGPDAEKRIHQRHLVAALDEVVAAKAVMQQSLFGADDGDAGEGRRLERQLERRLAERDEQMVAALGEQRAQVEAQLRAHAEAVQQQVQALVERQHALTLEAVAATAARGRSTALAAAVCAALALLGVAGAVGAVLAR